MACDCVCVRGTLAAHPILACGVCDELLICQLVVGTAVCDPMPAVWAVFGCTVPPVMQANSSIVSFLSPGVLGFLSDIALFTWPRGRRQAWTAAALASQEEPSDS